MHLILHKGHHLPTPPCISSNSCMIRHGFKPTRQPSLHLSSSCQKARLLRSSQSSSTLRSRSKGPADATFMAPYLRSNPPFIASTCSRIEQGLISFRHSFSHWPRISPVMRDNRTPSFSYSFRACSTDTGYFDRSKSTFSCPGFAYRIKA